MPLENFITSVSACSSRPVSRSTSLILCARSLRDTSSSAAKNSRFSRAERRGKNERSAATAIPTCRRTAPASRRVSKPPTRTDPASGKSMVEISLRTVVLPLPFGPTKANTSPRSAAKQTSLRAIVSPRCSRPTQLNKAGRWRKILRTDSKTIRSMEIVPTTWRPSNRVTARQEIEKRFVASFRSTNSAAGYRILATGYLEAEFLDFLVVILAVENRPLFGALNNGAPLTFNFLASGLVDARFLHKECFENLADFEANGVAVFDELDLIQVSDGVGYDVGEFVDLVAAQSHGRTILREVIRESLKYGLVFPYQ